MPTATIDEPEVIWEANRGGQWAFLSCPYWEVLADGDRGGGKSAALIACFLAYVGEGFGPDWRGVIFRMTYPELGDLVARSHELITPAYPGAAYNKSDHEWVFPEGEKLLFRHLDNLKAYDHYHGHSFCLAEDELIMTTRGNIPIKTAQVGDMVYTPSGFKRINRVYDTGVKECIKVSLYDSYRRLISEQRQSVDHQILTSEGWMRLPHSPMSCIYLPHPELSQPRVFGRHPLYADRGSIGGVGHYPFPPSTSLWPWKWSHDSPQISGQWPIWSWSHGAGESHLRGHQEIMDWHASLLNVRNCFSVFDGEHQDTQQPHLAFRTGGMPLETALPLYGSHQQISNECYFHGKLLKQLGGISGDLQLLPSDQQRLSEPSQLLQDEIFWREPSYDHLALPTALNWKGDCYFYCDPYDAQFRQGKEIDGFLFQQLSDAQERYLSQTRMDEMTDVQQCSRDYPYIVLPHPYGRAPIATCLPLDRGYVTSEPCGNLHTYDIEVEGVNCYFTISGILSSNCFIGFDELTTWPTHEPYEAMLSCSRPTSSKPGMPLMVRSTTNSFGVGFSWVKSRFVTGKKPNMPYGEPGMERIRIPIRWRDNRNFVETDPNYHSRLASTITNEGQRKAWLENSWDIISGGRFSDVFLEAVHVLEPFNIPQAWRLDRSFDWGSSAPFCTLWYAESNGESIPDGRSWPRGTIFVIHEDYGCQGDMLEPGWKPNVGLGLGPIEIAKRTLANEAKLREWGMIQRQPQPGPADDPMFDVTRGRSMASMMSELGLVWMKPSKGPGSRITGWQILEDKLKASMKWPMEEPGIFFFDTCRHLLRTLPAAQRDAKKIEDIDEAEDHALDCLRLRLLAHGGGSVLHGVSL